VLVVQSRAQVLMVRRLDGPRVSGVVLEGGTLTSSAAGCGRSPVRRHLGGVWKRIGWGAGVVGTLLGPEGAGPPGRDSGWWSFALAGPIFSSYRRGPRGGFRVWRGSGVGVWS
jgi:hypothetical protein